MSWDLNIRFNLPFAEQVNGIRERFRNRSEEGRDRFSSSGSPTLNLDAIDSIIENILLTGDLSASSQFISLYYNRAAGGQGTSIGEYTELVNPKTVPSMTRNLYALANKVSSRLLDLASEPSPYLEGFTGDPWFSHLNSKPEEEFDTGLIPTGLPSELKEQLSSVKTNQEALDEMSKFLAKNKDYKGYAIVTGLTPSVFADTIRGQIQEIFSQHIDVAKQQFSTSLQRLKEIFNLNGRSN